jgi:hypothetical protein
MDAVGGKSRMDVPDFVGRLVFDAAWIVHQQCCFWSSVATQGGEIRDRRRK